MNEQEKKKYLDEYKKEKEKGVPFFPDIIFKDTIAALLIFIILVALAYLQALRLKPVQIQPIPPIRRAPNGTSSSSSRRLNIFPANWK